jgi:hypothetical protein
MWRTCVSQANSCKLDVWRTGGSQKETTQRNVWRTGGSPKVHYNFSKCAGNNGSQKHLVAIDMWRISNLKSTPSRCICGGPVDTRTLWVGTHVFLFEERDGPEVWSKNRSPQERWSARRRGQDPENPGNHNSCVRSWRARKQGIRAIRGYKRRCKVENEQLYMC